MVHGIATRQVTIVPTAALRSNKAAVQTTSAFSVGSLPPRTAVAKLKVTPDVVALATASPVPPSQVSSASTGIRQLFSGLPTPAASAQVTVGPLVPSFQTATGTNGFIQYGVNHDYFATLETAQWIANKYGTGQVIEAPFGGSGGGFSVSANEYHIKLADGREVNAGILASYYERNPESQFPGLADKLIRGQLGLA